MTEYVAIEVLVKKAMEDGVAANGDRLRAVEAMAIRSVRARRMRRWRWLAGATSLVAASLALAVALRVMLVDGGTVERSGVDGAICVLCAVDGIDATNLASATPSEMLLAWQDAPCADLLMPN